jgi:type IV secretion system protein VirB9
MIWRGIGFLLCLSPYVGYAQHTPSPVASVSPPPVTARAAEGAVQVFPYGHGQPTILCARLRACIFELAPGETIVDKLLIGDGDRWVFDMATTGVGGGTQLLSIKPTDCDLTTNLTVPTDRHVYFLTLDSPPCPAHTTNAADAPYTRVFRFSYPDERTVRKSPVALPISGPRGTAPESLNFAYTWSADKHFPWRPEHVFDDGTHTYIKVPTAARAGVAPVLFALDPDGGSVVVNYTVANDFYITDRLSPRWTLVIGDGKTPQRVVITQTGHR